MAKIRHNNFIDTVDGVFSGAKKEGVLHLYAQGGSLNGRTIRIGGKEMFHFGTTGYLGLEQDDRLKEAAIEAIRSYGTQFPLSKSYISHPLYAALEHKIEKMYGIPPIVMKNSTLGHLGVIPTLVRDEDAVILDHQVHWSVQNACQLLKLRGIPVELVRHSNLQMLEDKIRALGSRARHIWYMADGVYSMYGDYAPVKDLLALAQRYPQLRLYFDDVHGMSWKGKNGTGFAFDCLGTLPENAVVVSTLSKTFGASGATFFCSDSTIREKIRNFGGPLTFSAQLEPASVAAAIASADIHLSPEITALQDDLASKISLFGNRLSGGSLPIIEHNDSPVFFLGMGTPATAYAFSKRLFEEGFFLNVGIYPAVPIKNTGMRITLSRHNRTEDIDALYQALEYHYPLAVAETGTHDSKIRKAFRMPALGAQASAPPNNTGLLLEERCSITEIPQTEWDSHMAGHNIMDWHGMDYLERSFAGHPDPVHRMDFTYYAVRDIAGTVVLMTFFTLALWKDDMMAPESVSRHLEEIRKSDPLHMTSKVFSMGSAFTEGRHCYIDEKHPESQNALRLLLDAVEEKYESLAAEMIILRDFDSENPWNITIQNQGYFRVAMPDSCVLENTSSIDLNGFASSLSPRSRKHFRKDIEPYEKHFKVSCKSVLEAAELEKAYKLYSNVHEKNLAVNNFLLPMGAFEQMNSSPDWEFLLLRLRAVPEAPLVGVMFCYKNSGGAYVPELIGMDYEASEGHGLYRQLLFRTVGRAIALGSTRIDFGISATFEKKKLGATVLPKTAYVQARDNYKLELMGTLLNEQR